MVVNFKARGISRGKCKLARTSTLIKKKYLILVHQKIKNNMMNKATKELVIHGG
jgi:hypothetical protein